LSIKVSKDFRGEPLGSMPIPMPTNQDTRDCVELDVKQGSLTFYESDI
jgi:hypothetical protein